MRWLTDILGSFICSVISWAFRSAFSAIVPLVEVLITNVRN